MPRDHSRQIDVLHASILHRRDACDAELERLEAVQKPQGPIGIRPTIDKTARNDSARVASERTVPRHSCAEQHGIFDEPSCDLGVMTVRFVRLLLQREQALEHEPRTH